MNESTPAHTVLAQLDQVLNDRKHATAESSYVASLYAKGLDHQLKKIGEESAEVIMAAKDLAQSPSHDNLKQEQHLIAEVTDLWFHSLVVLHQQNLNSQTILNELEKRFGLSGHDEKAARTQSTQKSQNTQNTTEHSC